MDLIPKVPWVTSTNTRVSGLSVLLPEFPSFLCRGSRHFLCWGRRLRILIKKAPDIVPIALDGGVRNAGKCLPIGLILEYLAGGRDRDFVELLLSQGREGGPICQENIRDGPGPDLGEDHFWAGAGHD